jgi:putative transcriptional regulator
MTKKIKNNFRVLKAKKEQELGRNLTYEDIYAETGISPTTLTSYARSKISLYSEDTILRLCEYFGCSLSDLLEIVE